MHSSRLACGTASPGCLARRPSYQRASTRFVDRIYHPSRQQLHHRGYVTEGVRPPAASILGVRRGGRKHIACERSTATRVCQYAVSDDYVGRASFPLHTQGRMKLSRLISLTRPPCHRSAPSAPVSRKYGRDTGIRSGSAPAGAHRKPCRVYVDGSERGRILTNSFPGPIASWSREICRTCSWRCECATPLRAPPHFITVDRPPAPARHSAFRSSGSDSTSGWCAREERQCIPASRFCVLRSDRVTRSGSDRRTRGRRTGEVAATIAHDPHDVNQGPRRHEARARFDLHDSLAASALDGRLGPRPARPRGTGTDCEAFPWRTGRHECRPGATLCRRLPSTDQT